VCGKCLSNVHTSKVSRDRTDTPIQFLEGQGKLRNGLFLRGVELYDDRVAFEVFASRALNMEDIADLRFTDGVGTEYEMVPPRVEGRLRVRRVLSSHPRCLLGGRTFTSANLAANTT
jgi:hypothetical protein